MSPRLLRHVILVVLLALVGAACSADQESSVQVGTQAGSSTQKVDDSADATPTDEVDLEDPAATADPAPLPKAPVAQPDEDEAVVGTPVDTSVLAYAVQASDGQSFSFEQGFSMDMQFFGLVMAASPEAPVVTGFVAGDQLYMSADMAEFFEEMFTSFGMSLDDPNFAPIAAALAEAQFEAWVDGETMVLDMSGFVAAMDGIQPGAMGELGALADGPVSIDLAELASVDPGTLVSDLGAQGADPSQVLAALLAIDAVAETGPSTLDGRPVTVYEGTMSMADFIEAQGADLDDQLAQFGDVGDLSSSPEIVAAVESMTVRTVVMIDEDDLVRRAQFDIDMSDMFESMADGESTAGFEGMFADAQMRMQIWQEYDNYGEAFVVELPDAVDVTDQFEALYGQLALM